MKKLVGFIFSSFFFFSLSVHGQTYLGYFDRATELEQLDSLEQAEKYYLQAIRLEPKNQQNALLYANIARLQWRQHRLEEALSSYGTSLAFQPYHKEVLLDRAALLLETGRTEEALVDCAMVMDLDSLNREALLMRSYIFYKKQDYAAAEKDYLLLLRESPLDSIASMGLALLYQKWDKPAKALAIWDALIEGSPQQSGLYLSRAEVERNMGNTEAALKDVDQYLSLTTPHADVMVLRGDLCMDLGRKDQARRNYLQAIELGMPRNELKERLKKSR